MGKTNNNNQSNQPTTYYIDATNVCYWRNPETPSLSVLLKLLLVLKRDKKQSFFCIFDANTAHKLPPEEAAIYTYMLNNDDFHQISGGKRADDFILSLADKYNGCVISNDNYSDPKYSRYKWKDRDARPIRLFMGEVIKTKDGEHLMLFDLDINVKLERSVTELFKELEPFLNPPKEHYEGVIKFFNPQKGTGTISFLKETNIPFTKPATSTQTFEDGQAVTFKISETGNVPVATDIDIVVKIWKGYISQYDEQREAGFITIDGGPQRLFFRKSYFADGVNTDKIAKNNRIECIIGSNSKGECAREVRFAEPEQAAETDDKTNEKIQQLEAKLKGLQELLLMANKKINEQAQALKSNHSDTNEQTETLKKLHREEIEILKQKFKAELQAVSGVKSKHPIAQTHTETSENKSETNKKKVANNTHKKKSKSKIEEKELQQENAVKTIQANLNGAGKEEKKLNKVKEHTPKTTITPPVHIAELYSENKTEQASTDNLTRKKLVKKTEITTPVAIVTEAPQKGLPTTQKSKSVAKKDTVLPVNKTNPAVTPLGTQSDKLPEELDTTDKRLNWWSKLEIGWKKAFNVLLGKGESTRKPSDEDLQRIVSLTQIDLGINGKHKLSFKLKNLFGIKYFYQLQYLDLSGHALTNINGMQNLGKLQHFNCSNNKISSLSGLGNLKQLKVFICAKNQLKGGNFKGISNKLPKLQELDCSDNAFSETDAKYFSGLKLKELKY